MGRLFTQLWRRMLAGARANMVTVNAWPALVVRDDRTLYAVIQPRTDGIHIDRIDAVVNPDKPQGLTRVLGLAVTRERLRPPATTRS